MKKVAVIGNSAGGKSTLCRVLKKNLDLPLLEIDQIFWTPNWQVAPAEEYNARHDAFIAKETWLVDGGGSWESVVKRMDVADTIIFLDMPLWRHCWWVTKRQIWSRKSGVGWKLTGKLYKMVWQMHKEMRPRIIAELARQDRSTKVITLRSLAELNAFSRATLPEHAPQSRDQDPEDMAE